MVQSPGRVLPGKPMAGRMGNTNSTTQNLLVQRIDTSLNLIFVKGAIPGPANGVIRLTDAMKGVRRVGRKNAIKGVEPYLKDVTSLPFPYGDDELASRLPVIVDAAPRALNVSVVFFFSFFFFFFCVSFFCSALLFLASKKEKILLN